MGTQDDIDVFSEYLELNRGGVPFIVIGCRFVRVGSGEALIFYNETINELNKTYPSDIDYVLDLYNQSEVIKEQAITALEANDTEAYMELTTNYSSVVDEASIKLEELSLITLICNVTDNEPVSLCG